MLISWGAASMGQFFLFADGEGIRLQARPSRLPARKKSAGGLAVTSEFCEHKEEAGAANQLGPAPCGGRRPNQR